MMFKKYCIIFFILCGYLSCCFATTHFIVNDYKISFNSDSKEANTNITNGLKNYFSRFEKVSSARLDDIIIDSKQNIRKSLEVFGYFSPTIKANYQNRKDGVLVNYHIQKGPRVKVVGLDISIPEKIVAQARLKKDIEKLYNLNEKPYDGIVLAKIKEDILDKIRSTGYPFSEFEEASMSFINPVKIVLKFKLNLNKYYVFGNIIIKDSKLLKDSFIKSYANFKPGDPYDALLLGQFQKDLVSSGFFDEVNVHPINWKNQLEEVPIIVNVIDTKPRTRSYTVGYDDKYHIGGSVGYQIKPYNNMGHTLEFFIRLATNDYVQLKTNYIVPSKKPLERLYLFSSQILTQNLNVGEADSGLLTFAIQQKYRDWLIIPGINIFIEHSMPSDQSNYTTELIYPQLNFVYKVKKPYPWLNRFFFGSSLMASSEDAFSGISMSRITLRSELLFPLSEKFDFQFSGGVGAISSSDLDDVPLTLKFYAGGPDSIRGYSYNEFGPGRYEKNLSYELQYKLSNLLEPYVFIDQGSASNKWDDKLKSSIGVGMMFNFKVIGLKFSLARGLEDGSDPYKIQFTVQSMS